MRVAAIADVQSDSVALEAVLVAIEREQPDLLPPMSRSPASRIWLLLGPDVELRRTPYDLEAAIERLRAGGCPASRRSRG